MIYKVIKNPPKKLVDIYVGKRSTIPQTLMNQDITRVVRSGVKALGEVIDIHRAKDNDINSVYFPFSCAFAEKIALICIKRNVLIIDSDTDKRLVSQSKELPKLAYLLSVYKEFPSSKEIKALVYAAVKSITAPLQRNQAISLVADELNKHEQEIKSIINLSPCPVKKAVQETVSIETSYPFDPLKPMRFGAFDEYNRGVFVVRAGTGTGKTYHAIRMCMREKKKGRKTALISNLISVVRQHKPKNVKLAIYDDEMHKIEDADHFSLTINAIVNDFHYYKLKQTDTIIFDECEKVLQALYDPNVTYIPLKQKLTIRSRIGELLEDRKRKLIFMDADASDKVTSTFVNEYRKSIADITIVNFPTTLYQNIEAHVEELVEVTETLISKKLLDSKSQFIACDSRRMIERLLSESGYKDKSGYACIKSALKSGILVVHSQVKSFKEQADFLKNPNEEIAKYRTVIVSPSLREGFDIKTPFCDEVMVLSNNVLQPLQLIQLARRLRKASKIRFAVSHKVNMWSDITELGVAQKENETIDDRLEREFIKREALLKFDQPLALKETLKALGFNVIVHPISLSALHSEKTPTIKEEEQESIPKARVLKDSEYYQLKTSSALTVTDRFALQRWEIAKTLDIPVKDVIKEVVEFYHMFDIEAAKLFLQVTHGVKETHPAYKLVSIASALQLSELTTDSTFEILNSVDKKSLFKSIIINKENFINCFDKRHQNMLMKMDIKDKDKPNTATTRLNILLKILGIEHGTPIGNTKNKRVPYYFHPLAKRALSKQDD
ncbi:hypothetical protein [Vibrio sp. 10N.261.54.A5]|uniref:hypothetical protein n=1 Tax=Vibrio sp. 10N.261.54.A5 TaxID=3229686 RepID=UPI00354EA9B6